MRRQRAVIGGEAAHSALIGRAGPSADSAPAPSLTAVILHYSSILLLVVKSAFNHFIGESLVYSHVSGFEVADWIIDDI